MGDTLCRKKSVFLELKRSNLNTNSVILFLAYAFFDLKIFVFVVFFLPRLVPGMAFVVIGLIPLSALASWTHCVSFCSPQEGRTGASVFGLAMSKSALLVPTQDGCTCLSLSLSLRKTWPHLYLAEGLQPNTEPFMCGCGSVMAVTLPQSSRAVSLKRCLPGCCCQSEMLLLILMQNISVYSESSLKLKILLKMNTF